jgi:hypothetical protein
MGVCALEKLQALAVAHEATEEPGGAGPCTIELMPARLGFSTLC